MCHFNYNDFNFQHLDQTSVPCPSGQTYIPNSHHQRHRHCRLDPLYRTEASPVELYPLMIQTDTQEAMTCYSPIKEVQYIRYIRGWSSPWALAGGRPCGAPVLRSPLMAGLYIPPPPPNKGGGEQWAKAVRPLGGSPGTPESGQYGG